MPEYPVIYKIYIKDADSVTAVRKAHGAFMAKMKESVDASETFIAFGTEGLILDVGNDIKIRSPSLCSISNSY